MQLFGSKGNQDVEVGNPAQLDSQELWGAACPFSLLQRWAQLGHRDVGCVFAILRLCLQYESCPSLPRQELSKQ